MQNIRNEDSNSLIREWKKSFYPITQQGPAYWIWNERQSGALGIEKKERHRMMRKKRTSNTRADSPRNTNKFSFSSM